MRTFTFLLVFALATVLSGLAIPKKYAGHQVLKVHLKTKKDVETFKAIDKDLRVDIWRSPKKLPGTMDVRVSPVQKEALLKVFGEHSIDHKMMIEDLQL